MTDRSTATNIGWTPACRKPNTLRGLVTYPDLVTLLIRNIPRKEENTKANLAAVNAYYQSAKRG